MKFPCELLAEPYLAQIRIEVTRKLKAKGYTQTETAELLQVSQPVVSGYLKKSRDQKELPQVIMSKAFEVAEEISEILHNQGIDGTADAIATGCHQCKIMRQQGPTCVYHKSVTSDLGENCTSCLSQAPLIELQHNKEGVLTELNRVFTALMESDNFDRIIPQIGMQMINSIEQPDSMSDIAAFPGRIIKRKGKQALADTPIFGGSETTSQLLLDIRESGIDVRSIAAIKTTEWLSNRLKQLDLPFTRIKGFEENMKEKINSLSIDTEPVIIMGTESIGYESITYICASSCDDLQQLLLAILR